MIVALVGSLLSGCAKEKPILDELGEDGTGKLRVMYYGEDQFYRDYGGYFGIEYQNIEIEVVDMQSMYAQTETDGVLYDPKKTLIDFIEKEKPDMIAKGKLYNLDPLIQQEKYDLSGMLPGLIDMLRAKGNDGLYGLTPSFYTKVIFYNADLFKQHNIELPRNQMSWKEVLELGARFGQIGSGDDQHDGNSGIVQSAAA